jgi:hypothetical protein
MMEEAACPYCGTKALERRIGSWAEQYCGKCGALEFGDADDIGGMEESGFLSKEEIEKGWYKPGTIFAG